MKNKILMLCIAVCSAFPAASQWTIDSVNTAGIYPFAAGTTGKAVFSNGGEWNVFDAATTAHSWGNFTISRSMVEVVTHGEKVYFGGGKYGYFADPQYTKNVDVYDAITDSWSLLTLSKNREVGGAAAIGNKILFAGGTGRTDISGPVYIYSTVDIFDATTGARTTGKLSKARSNIATGASGNKVVFAGGWYWDASYNQVSANNADIYDVTTGGWTKTTLSKKRENIAVAVVGSKIVFAGGNNSTSGAAAEVDVYDAATDTWTTATLPAARYGMKSVVIGDAAYFAGGLFDPVENAVDIYNVVNSTWATIYMPTSVSAFSMSVINGKIYFAGGYYSSSGTYADIVQVFDPVNLKWTTEQLSQARSYISAVTCGNRGFFAGGYKAYGYPTPASTNRVDIYNSGAPLADFSASATMITAGQSIDFTDLSTGAPTSWEWTFSGATPSTSSQQNPGGIVYSMTGVYDVTLTATNSAGSNTVTKAGFITVNPAPCMVPSVFSTTGLTATMATINWGAVPGALKYKASYRPQNGGTWINSTVVNPTWSLTGLMPNTTYVWKVKSVCANSVSSVFSPNQTFTTLPARLSGETVKSIGIYPEPVGDQFRITLQGDVAWPLTCSIYDLQGNLIRSLTLTDYAQTVKVVDMAAGYYMLTVVDGNNNRWSARMVKE